MDAVNLSGTSSYDNAALVLEGSLAHALRYGLGLGNCHRRVVFALKILGL